MSILNEPLVYIVIVNYNGKDLLRRCLDSLKRTYYKNYRIIVIDNGSIDGSVEMIHNLYPYVELIALRRNVGYARANNYGIVKALRRGAKYIVLMNNDIEIIDPFWLYKAVVVMEKYRDIGIVGVNLINLDGTSQQYPAFKEPVEVKELSFALAIIRANVFREIGFLDPGFVLGGSEDTDFCFRARKCWYKLVYIPSIKVFHLRSATLKKFHAETIHTLSARNYIRHTIKNYSIAELVKTYVLLTFITRRNGYAFRKDLFKRLKWLTRGFLKLAKDENMIRLLAERIKTVRICNRNLRR